MANTKLIFCGTDESQSETFELQAYCNLRKELFIQIDHRDDVYPASFICLDRETAIKLSKEIRRQIALMSED